MPNVPDSPTEVREVRAELPELSPATNARVSEELQEVVGTDRVEVPRDRPHATRGEHPGQHGFVATLNQHRFQFIQATAIVLTFGAIVALSTGKWWLLPVAAAVHALGTLTVVMTILRLTTTSEHPSPEVVAAMEAEGVAHADEQFSRMVAEFRDTPEHGAREVLSPGNNERTSEAHQEPAHAAAEQSSAMTPTAGPSRPSGGGALPDIVVQSVAVSLLVLSLVYGAAQGGWMWLLPAVMVPLLIGWVLLQRAMVSEGDAVHLRSRRRIAAIVIGTGAAVAIFCAIVVVAH